MPYPRRTWEQLLEVLNSKTIVNENGCFEWRGSTAGLGYGVIHWGGKNVYIHRLMYEHAYGKPANVLRHTCDNPRCWNLQHLVDGTHMDNTKDKIRKGRNFFANGYCNSKLTEQEVREIKSSTLSKAELSKKYQISLGAINNILKGVTWKHIGTQ